MTGERLHAVGLAHVEACEGLPVAKGRQPSFSMLNGRRRILFPVAA